MNYKCAFALSQLTHCPWQDLLKARTQNRKIKAPRSQQFLPEVSTMSVHTPQLLNAELIIGFMTNNETKVRREKMVYPPRMCI